MSRATPLVAITVDEPGVRLSLAGRRLRLYLDGPKAELAVITPRLFSAFPRVVALPFAAVEGGKLEVGPARGGPLALRLSLRYDAGGAPRALTLPLRVEKLDRRDEALDLASRVAAILGFRGYHVRRDTPEALSLELLRHARGQEGGPYRREMSPGAAAGGERLFSPPLAPADYEREVSPTASPGAPEPPAAEIDWSALKAALDPCYQIDSKNPQSHISFFQLSKPSARRRPSRSAEERFFSFVFLAMFSLTLFSGAAFLASLVLIVKIVAPGEVLLTSISSSIIGLVFLSMLLATWGLKASPRFRGWFFAPVVRTRKQLEQYLSMQPEREPAASRKVVVNWRSEAVEVSGGDSPGQALPLSVIEGLRLAIDAGQDGTCCCRLWLLLPGPDELLLQSRSDPDPEPPYRALLPFARALARALDVSLELPADKGAAPADVP